MAQTNEVLSERKSISKFIKEGVNIRAYSMVLALMLIWIVFSILTDGTFLIPRNISNLARQMAVVCYIAMGMVLVIISGNIDLSVGSLLGMLGGFAAITQVYWGWSTPVTIIVTLMLGIITGCYQGFIIAYLRVPAFIVTLGGLLTFRGILLGLTGGRTISPMNSDFRFLGQAYIGNLTGLILSLVAVAIFGYMIFNRRRVRKSYHFEVEPQVISFLKIVLFALGVFGFTVVMNLYMGIPIPVLIMIALVIILTIVSKKTKFGRNIYAIGGNIEAARYSGINIKKTMFFVFVVSAVLSAISGLVLTSRLDAGTVSAGDTNELDAIAAAVIGGASLSGGIGTVPGAMLGALIMASLDNGMSMMNVEVFWQLIIKGLILIVAVLVDVYTNEKAD